MAFPTEKEFLEWWDNKEDRLLPSRARSKTCPIARYVRSHGHWKAEVGASGFYRLGTVAGPWEPLPEWAGEFVRAADRALDKDGPYRGLPPGYTPTIDEE